ncbi:outer membrane beta-barrel protein [Gemmatimonadota bacterium]
MRRSIPILAGLILLGITLTPANAAAQELKLTVQGGLTYNYPLADFASDEGTIGDYPTTGFAEPTYGFKLRAIMNISPTLGLFLEINRPKFNGNLDAVLERLGLPWVDDYEASWNLNIFSIGARLSPVQIAMAKPYVQVGLGQYKTEIFQRFGLVEETEESDIQRGLSFGAGTMLTFGQFGIDIGAQYHAVEFIFGGQSIDWKANWLEATVMLSINLTP